VADSSSCRHLSQVGSTVNPSLKRYIDEVIELLDVIHRPVFFIWFPSYLEMGTRSVGWAEVSRLST
jgi:hypothetical protein